LWLCWLFICRNSENVCMYHINFCRRLNRWWPAAVRCRDPLMGFVEMTADESTQDWTHLVRSRANLQNLAAISGTSSLTVKLTPNVVQGVNAVRDSELSMQNHVKKDARTCFYHIRRLKQVWKLLGPDVAAKLVVSLVFSKLDYCNAILAGFPRSTIAPSAVTPTVTGSELSMGWVGLGHTKWTHGQLCTGYPSNSESWSSYVCWCIQFIQDERHLTSKPVRVCSRLATM